VVGNARSESSFSATVQLPTSTPNIVGACAYASNYPPVAGYITASQLSCSGTPPYTFVLKAAEGDAMATGASLDGSYLIPASYTVQSFTDKTGAPGILACMPPSSTYTLTALDVCLGTGATFTLSGSQSGPDYRLYRDNSQAGGETIAGTGGALTFNDMPLTADAFTYTVRMIAPNAQCEIQVSEERSITVNALPTEPTGASAGTRCGAGTVTFSATAPDGCTIDWYAAESGGSIVTGGYGTTSFAPLIASSTTYYAEARHATNGCVSATRLDVSGTVRSGGTIGAPATPGCSSGRIGN
jgi:hypothetical protein